MSLVIADISQEKKGKVFTYSIKSQVLGEYNENLLFQWLFVNIIYGPFESKIIPDQKIAVRIYKDGKINNYIFRRTKTDYLNFIKFDNEKYIIESNDSGIYSNPERVLNCIEYLDSMDKKKYSPIIFGPHPKY